MSRSSSTRAGASITDHGRYVVEKILKHDWNEDGTLLFEVKWQGYDEVSDRTWEPEENLSVKMLKSLATVSS